MELIVNDPPTLIFPGEDVNIVPVFTVKAPKIIPVPVGAGSIRLAPVLKVVVKPPVRLKVE